MLGEMVKSFLSSKDLVGEEGGNTHIPLYLHIEGGGGVSLRPFHRRAQPTAPQTLRSVKAPVKSPNPISPISPEPGPSIEQGA